MFSMNIEISIQIARSDNHRSRLTERHLIVHQPSILYFAFFRLYAKPDWNLNLRQLFGDLSSEIQSLKVIIDGVTHTNLTIRDCFLINNLTIVVSFFLICGSFNKSY